MLPTTPESAFIFSVFQLLLSGVIWLVYSFLLFRPKDEQRSRVLYFLVAAFFLYSAHLFLEMCLNLDVLFGRSVIVSGSRFSLLKDGLETAALFCLVFVYLPHWIPPRRQAIPAVASAVLILAAALFAEKHGAIVQQVGLPMRNLLNLSLLSAAIGLYFQRRGPREWFTVSPLMPLLLSELGKLLTPSLNPLRNAEEFLQLASLVLFALVLDRKSRDLHVRVFVRMNLIFILMASGLVLTITETERMHYQSFAELNVEELSEFLRGHALYFWKQGQSAEQIVVSPGITRKIVSEFGRIPALRRVGVFLGGIRMEMSIAPDGTVDQQIGREGAIPTDPRRNATRSERIATLVHLPIVFQQQQLGHIEIDESLQAIDARIANQMLVVFLAFTVMALLSGTLIGLTVRDAKRTIRRQYQELEKTHEQLLHAAKLASVGQLADGVAHEINNPAGIILARTEYLASVIRERDGYADIHGDIEAIRRQAGRISEIVGGLLTFSRPSALQIRQMDMNQLVTECLGLLAPKFYARGIEVQNDLDKALPSILADPDRLEQVFINILNNALEAMPEGGKLNVQTRVRPDQKVSAKISDTGIGIRGEDLKRIFDPFFTTKEAGRGTGLGLSISYGIVRDHGGTIEVSSSPGPGTIFDIILPLREERHDWI